MKILKIEYNVFEDYVIKDNDLRTMTCHRYKDVVRCKMTNEAHVGSQAPFGNRSENTVSAICVAYLLSTVNVNASMP